MTGILFEGQQTDERILAEIRPHPFKQLLDVALILLLALFFVAVVMAISTILPVASGFIRLAAAVGGVAIAALGIWWVNYRQSKSIAYITDRRVMRFEPATPLVLAKRSLFWNEVLKAKAYTPNLLSRILNIGNVILEPHLSESENIVIRDVFMYEDLANYIDKILFTFKNKPEEISAMKPFVAKPRWKRY